MILAPRFVPETEKHPGRLDLGAALRSTVGVSAIVFGVVHSSGAGWTDGVTVASLAPGVLLVGLFVVTQRRAAQPIMPLRLSLTDNAPPRMAHAFCSTARW